MNAQEPLPTSTPASVVRARPSAARALVTALSVTVSIGLTLVLGYLLDVFWGPDPEGALAVVILGAAILLLSGTPLVVVLLLPWWRLAVAAPLRDEGRARAVRILWWSAGACGLGMLYALRYLAHNPGDWHDVVDEEITLLPLLLVTVAAFVALAARAGWAKVLARVVFIVFFIPWALYNPLGSLVGLGIMFFGLRALRAVQPEIPVSPAPVLPGRWSPDGAYWWDGAGWRQTSSDRRHYWSGESWQAIAATSQMPG
jgi:hypothetical protein